MSKILLDTNILMQDKAKEGYITYPVLQELDRLKTKEGLTGKQARDAIHSIFKNPKKFPLKYTEPEKDESVDDFLVRTALANDWILRTLDLSLHLKATAKGAKTEYCHNGNDHYSGSTFLSDEEYSLLSMGKLPEKYPDNHFLIYDNTAHIIKEGVPTRLSYHCLQSTYCGTIKPRNIEQYCLMELLTTDISIVAGTGKPGSGKSYLMLNYALTELEKGNITKLVFVPANAYVKDSFDIAALPGGLLEKQEHMLGPLIDIVGISKIRYLVVNDLIEVLPLATARGRSFTDSIVYCSEAQNLSEDHMQLILSRLANGSRLFIDGDYQGQIDKRIFENKNGIKLLFNLAKTKDAELFGTVQLTKIERSRVAQLAEVLADYR